MYTIVNIIRIFHFHTHSGNMVFILFYILKVTYFFPFEISGEKKLAPIIAISLIYLLHFS